MQMRNIASSTRGATSKLIYAQSLAQLPHPPPMTIMVPSNQDFAAFLDEKGAIEVMSNNSWITTVGHFNMVVTPFELPAPPPKGTYRPVKVKTFSALHLTVEEAANYNTESQSSGLEIPANVELATDRDRPKQVSARRSLPSVLPPLQVLSFPTVMKLRERLFQPDMPPQSPSTVPPEHNETPPPDVLLQTPAEIERRTIYHNTQRPLGSIDVKVLSLPELEKVDSSPIYNLIYARRPQSLANSMQMLKHRLSNQSTVMCCFPSIGVIGKMIKDVFGDVHPSKRPTFVQAIPRDNLQTVSGYSIRKGELGFLKIGPLAITVNDGLTPGELERRETQASYLINTILAAPALGACKLPIVCFNRVRISKLVCRAVIHPLTVIYECQTGWIFSTEERVDIARRLIHEAVQVLQSIDNTFVNERNLQRIVMRGVINDAMTNTLMYDCFRAGRDTTFDLDNGWIIEEGRRLNIPCPTHEAVGKIIKEKVVARAREIGAEKVARARAEAKDRRAREMQQREMNLSEDEGLARKAKSIVRNKAKQSGKEKESNTGIKPWATIRNTPKQPNITHQFGTPLERGISGAIAESSNTNPLDKDTEANYQKFKKDHFRQCTKGLEQLSITDPKLCVAVRKELEYLQSEAGDGDLRLLYKKSRNTRGRSKNGILDKQIHGEWAEGQTEIKYLKGNMTW
ncbi:2-dehydropantoate 2-reductase (Ketopantoate reductase) (KPA reductase) (KPR) [Clarireedia jacksonii]